MVDYSKWKNIEVSDDEDDTHPNIDTPSLFKWRHEARIKRMQEFEDEKKRIKINLMVNEQKINEIKKKYDKDSEKLKDELDKLELEKKNLNEKNEELKKKEKLMPWNVDTISKEKFNITVINKPKPLINDERTEEEELEFYKNFVKENESKIKVYAMLSKWDDSKRYLLDNKDLCCKETTSYLSCWCINLQLQGKTDLMYHVSKQVISLEFVFHIAKYMNCDPRSCISIFFTKIQKADKEYQDAFNNELESFIERIKETAKKKLDEATKEVEEEERLKRLGPGGLDPIEVFESLPEPLKECFDKKDTEKLKQVLSEMDNEEGHKHIQRCIDSGLWIPDKNAQEINDQSYSDVEEGDDQNSLDLEQEKEEDKLK